ncbi:MAG: cell division protein ZapD [Gammaproteobacteria bacterium]|nr:cell division protein ZapD [Gammaproteobacteria bacterium]
MLKIGLTGGIGSGKTAAANYFAELGVPVIDADVIARELVKSGLPAYNAIVEQFGCGVLKSDNELDRAKLREIIFADSSQRAKLENILHPLIRLKINKEISRAEGPYCLIVMPLMIETGQTDLVDQLVVVDAPIAFQVKRTVQRDEIDAAEVEAIIRAQVDGPTRRSVADFIIDNNSSLESLKEKVKQLHELFIQSKNTLVDDGLINDNINISDDNNKTRIQAISDMPLLNTAEAVDDCVENPLGFSENTSAHPSANKTSLPDQSSVVYELPFNEKVRTFVRLESLFNEIEYKLQGKTVWDTRSTINTLMALLNAFARPEIKSDLMKEMDRMNNVLSKYASMDGVNTGRLQHVQDELCQTAKKLKALEGQIGQNLKLNELVMSIRQRDSLPGGALGIDVPNYAHWLAQDIEVRNADIRNWLKEFELVKNAVSLVLRLIRDSAIESEAVAKNGVYQHVLETGTMAQIIRVVLPKNSPYFPEISGGRHRFTVRFLKPMGADRPVQVEQDIPFKIICCAL